MRDAMTPLERVSLLLIDEPPDRLIRMPLLTVHCAAVAGLDPADCCRDAALMTRAQLAAQERYRHDGFTVFSDVAIVAEASGSELRHRAGAVPILERPVLADAAEIAALELPAADAGRFPVLVETVRALHRARGDEVPIFCLVPGPFTTAAALRGVEDWLVDLLVDPDAATAVLDFAVRATEPLLDEIVLAGGLPALADPLASASVASPAVYRAFAGPATRRLVDRLHRLDLDVMLHVCGDTAPILGEIAATGADLLSFDRTPVATARDAIGDRVRLVGNVAVDLVREGTAAAVAEAAAAAAREGASTPKGFVLSTGCEVPVEAPADNVRALMEGGGR